MALKIVDIRDQAQLGCFWLELASLLHVRGHPNVVNVRGILLMEELHCYAIVLDMLKGGPVSSWWKSHRRLRQGLTIPEDTTAGIVRSLTLALQHCHAKGVLHLDVKEDNIVFGGDTGETESITLIDLRQSCEPGGESLTRSR